MMRIQARETPLTEWEQAVRKKRLIGAFTTIQNCAVQPDKTYTSTALKEELAKRMECLSVNNDGFIEDVLMLELLADCVEEGIMTGTAAMRLGGVLMNEASDLIEANNS
jgi:hypothetical protein